MPELPDVEAFRRVLVSCGTGKVIEQVDVYDIGVLHGVSRRRLRCELEGRTFGEPERHGKWLLVRTDGPTVLLHFGMTGQLVCCQPDEELHAHDRVVFTVSGDQQLRYRDQRKLKGLWLTSERGVARLLDGLGPDAATLTRAELDALLTGRRGSVKRVLTDQSVLAGLGNLLADEILWRSRLHPARSADGITREERGRLYTNMGRTLRRAERAGAVPPRSTWLTGRRAAVDATCPRCGERLCRSRIGGRGTVWCPRCQPEVS